MSAIEKNTTTARDALITELLSDVGHLHDSIKNIPKLLELSMDDSLRIVADAVEDAEDTALFLQTSTKELIQATTTKAGEQLENRVSALSGNLRDTQATRFNHMMLAGLIVMAAIMVGGMTWIAIESQDVSETNKWFYQEYKAQRALLEKIPTGIQEKYRN